MTLPRWLVLAVVATLSAGVTAAGEVEDLILSHVDPTGSRGTVVKYYSELTSSEQQEYDANRAAGEGYYIPPTHTVTNTQGGYSTHAVSKMWIVELGMGAIATPGKVTCIHSGCQGSQCSTTGCSPTTVDGQPACTGASCSGSGCSGNPTCGKQESSGAAGFEVFLQ